MIQRHVLLRVFASPNEWYLANVYHFYFTLLSRFVHFHEKTTLSLLLHATVLNFQLFSFH